MLTYYESQSERNTMAEHGEETLNSLLKMQHANTFRIEFFLQYHKMIPTQDRTTKVIQGGILLLRSYWNHYARNHFTMLKLAQPKFKDKLYIIYSAVEEMFCAALRELNGELTAKQNSTGATRSLPSVFPPETIQLYRANLPTIKIPEFDGTFIAWRSFRKQFISLVHTNVSLTNSRRLFYLKMFLTAEADQLVRHLPLTDENYRPAWNAVVKRYDNKQMLVQAYMHKLLNRPPMREESADELRALLTDFLGAVEVLKSLGRPMEKSGDLLLHILAQHLDTGTRTDWETSIADSANVPEFADLGAFLYGRLLTLELIDTCGFKPPRRLTIRQTECKLCPHKHRLAYCPVFHAKSIEQRRTYIREQNRCFICLRGYHVTNDCPLMHRCLKCNAKHHRLVHVDAVQTTAFVCVGRQPTPSTATTSSTATKPIQTVAITMTDQVLLPTAMILVRSRTGQLIPLRALIDQGAQASVVTEAALQLLQLPKRSNSHAFSGPSVAPVALTARLSCNSIYNTSRSACLDVTVKVVSQLNDTLPSKDVCHANWSHLAGVNVADPEYYRSEKIDCTLGADVLPTLLLDGIKRGPTGTPMAQHTRFGWILSGPVADATTGTAACADNQLYAVLEGEYVDVDGARDFVGTHTRDSRSQTGSYTRRL